MEDLRIKGVATIAGFLVNSDVFTATYGEDGMAQRREQAVAATKKFDETGEQTMITVYSETDPDAANYIPFESAFDYYDNPKRGNAEQYTNKLDVASWANWLSFDALGETLKITTPTMVVHSDESALPDNAKALYAAVQGEKELVWSDGNHYDYYDSPKQIDDAVANVSRFFHVHLV